MRSRLLVVWLTAAVTALSVLAASPAEAASKPSRLTVVITTPKGVPGTVAVTGAAKRTLAKAPSGRRVTRTVTVKSGRYAIRPRQIVRGGRVYLPTKTVQRVKVMKGRTTKVSVTYRRAATATGLAVRSLGTSSISVGWSAPKKAQVRVRRTAGTKPASSVRAGRAVRIKGRTATATGLTQGTTHTLSVFTKVKGRWVGPISVTASPRSPKSSGRPTFVTAPDTVMVPASAPVTIRPNGRRVTSTVPRGVQPVVGQAWVVPSTSRLPGGYLGRVVAIAASGTTVTLEPIGYPEAFDHLSFTARVNSTEKLRVASVGPADVPAAKIQSVLPQVSVLATKSCGPVISSTLDKPTARLVGEVQYAFTGTSFPGIPEAQVSMDVGLELDWDVKLPAYEMDCRITFGELNRAMSAGPIPLGLTASIHANLKLSLTEPTRVDLGAKLGVRATAKIENARLSASADPYSSLTTSDSPAGFSGAMRAGGDILLGPGTATPDAGVIAGLRGSFYPAELTADPIGTPEAPCLKLALSSSGDAELEGRAWFGPASISKTMHLFGKTWEHNVAHLPAGCQNAPDPEPTIDPPGPTDPTEPTEEPTIDPGAHRLESVTTSGAPALRGAREPSVSGDGRFVAYVSESEDLDPDRPRRTDYRVYVRDRVTGAIAPAPAPPSSEPLVRSYYPVISRDGRHVAYVQRTFVMGSYESAHVTVWDRVAGTTTVLPGDVGNAANIPAISADGRHVLYSTVDEIGSGTLRLWDRTTGEATPVSDGEEQPFFYALSPSGTSVAMLTVRAPVGEDAEGAPWSTTVWNRGTDRRTVVASGTADGAISMPAAVSDAGDRVVLNEIATGDDGTAVVKLWDGATGTTVTATPPEEYTIAFLPRASDGFSAVVFAALTADSTRSDVFEWSPGTGRVRRLSQTPSGERGNQLSLEPAISADGRIVVYSTAATNLVEGPNGSAAHVVSWDRALAKD